MHRYRLPTLLLGLVVFMPTAAAAQTADVTTMSLEQVIDRVTQTERALIGEVRELRPIVEAYIQELAPQPNGAQQPTAEAYGRRKARRKDCRGPARLPARWFRINGRAGLGVSGPVAVRFQIRPARVSR